MRIPSALRPAPLWSRAAAAVIRRLPFGRYGATHAIGHLNIRPFIATLPADLGGFSFHCDLGDAIAREACFTGRYEPQDTQLLRGLIRPGDTVVDLGANWGYYTLAAAHWTTAAGRVVAFEPDPRLFAILERNVGMNRLAHVVLEHRAVGAAAGRSGFLGYRDGTENRGVSRMAGSKDVADFFSPLVALDEALDDLGVRQVRLVKMDIEGAEVDALLGMRPGLGSHRYQYVLVEIHPSLLASRGSSPTAALQPLTDAGYRLWSIDHSSAIYRRAARRHVAAAELLRPFDPGRALEAWPHLLAVAPGLHL